MERSVVRDPAYHGGISKIERHGWRQTIGKAADFGWIDKNALRVDHRYQRSLHKIRILTMARDWDWVACGAIIVALRGDGEWFVIDGQHRVEAARHRADIGVLPCLIFEVEGLKEEAAGFLASNVGRKAMSYVERFNALIAAGDATALRVEGMIDGSGRKISMATGPNTISCMATMMRAMVANEAALRRIWPLVLRVCEGRTIDSTVLDAFFWVETSLPVGVSLSSRNWSERVGKVGLDAIKRSIAASAAYRGKAGPRSYGLGLVAAINRGLRNPLVLRGDRAETEGVP